MTDQTTPTERHPDSRYRLGEPDGTWWELGWDQPLGTFYARHHDPVPYDPFTPDGPLEWHGTAPREHPTIESLAARLPVAIPDDVGAYLAHEAAALPHVEPRHLSGWQDPARHEVVPRAAWEADLTRREEDVTTSTAVTDASQRWSLPSEPLAIALRALRDDSYANDAGIVTFSRGIGIDPDLVQGVLDGSVDPLPVERVAEVCEALRCSPYEIWGPDLGRQILHAYGPERWPRHIEPLNEGRRPHRDFEFVSRRVDQRARDNISCEAQVTPLEVTRFRQTGIVALDATGNVTRFDDLAVPAEPRVEYHFAFRQLGRPQLIDAPLSPADFARGCPPGYDADPHLTAMADTLDRDNPGTDMIRFRGAAAGVEQWLGRETPFDTWQTWDDPRVGYPGAPTDVLATADFDDGGGLGHLESRFDPMNGGGGSASESVETLGLDL